MANTKWPKGKTFEAFKKVVAQFAEEILEETVLSVDPGTHQSGWAKFVAGEFVESGTIKMTSKKPVQGRLPELYDALAVHQKPRFMIVEQIRGPTVNGMVRWAAGVAIAAVRGFYLIECPYEAWKAVRDDTYTKTDENDARCMALAVITLAKELTEG